MALLGPDGNPIIAPIIGAKRTVCEFEPIPLDMAREIAKQMEMALSQGVPDESPVNIPSFVVCQMLSRILAPVTAVEAEEE
jgi:hypothetical protein